MLEVAETAVPPRESTARGLVGLDLVTLVVAVAVLQLVIGRVLVPHYQPAEGVTPPDWHAALAWVARFLRHFLGVLAPAVLATQASLLVLRRSDLYP
ncbi:MAG TPA: hypothetical protein VFX50_04005, partial [Gemmatimonadales bacterium]|nr:hypothetical protein [Gemmatimonadales bacterium]